MSKKLFRKRYLYLFFLISLSLGFFYFFPQKTYAGCTLTGTYHIFCTCPVGCPSPMCSPFCSGGSFPGDWCATARCNPATGCWSENFYICDPPDACCQGCFTGETGIQLKTEPAIGGSKLETKEIKDLKPGEIVSSFDPETGEVKEGTVSDVTKTTREGYYILETESGKKVKVTGEHPFLAIKGENNQAPNTKFQTTLNKLEEIFSHTLTYKLITGFQAKVSEVLK